MLAKKQAGKGGGGREPGAPDAGTPARRCTRSGSPGALLAALLASAALLACLYLGVKTSRLQARIAALESAQGDPLSVPWQPQYLDQLKATVQEKVERLLAQKSYEHMAKIRIAREAPSECNCPAGKVELRM
ncbi:collagen alpha-1(XXV) chain-like [Erinaceus europaeus]|uniref:Collagen alpha-1(XXV) chain-like n=1 Tax=Erinaceus europaeus TaxID=9365 RepID=A0ABM3WTM7_ERIEU|nr:collagen alpha-1(XXV) chain-like [Erinaceus europaeus]